MVQDPICNSGDMTFPQALGVPGEVLSTEEQVCGRVAQGLKQEGQKSDIWENFLT